MANSYSAATYDSKVEALKTFIAARAQWIDNNIGSINTGYQTCVTDDNCPAATCGAVGTYTAVATSYTCYGGACMPAENQCTCGCNLEDTNCNYPPLDLPDYNYITTNVEAFLNGNVQLDNFIDSANQWFYDYNYYCSQGVW